METGKVTTILGRNDCKKSSLLNIAFGNLKPKYKLVRLDNKPLLKPLYSTGIAKFLPQYNVVPDGFKLSFIFKLYDLNWKVLLEILRNFKKFSNYEQSKLKTLSGGERRLIETYIILSEKKSKSCFWTNRFRL